MPLWTPSNITTAGWYDASDTSTITAGVTGNVSQWDDKSGNGNDVIQANGTYQPVTNSRTISGLNALDFFDDDFLWTNTNIGLSGNPEVTVITVMEMDTWENGAPVIWKIGDPGAGQNIAGEAFVTGSRWLWRHSRYPFNGRKEYSGVSLGSPTMVAWTQQKDANIGLVGENQIFQNGTEQVVVATSSSVSYPLTVGNQVNIGGNNSNPFYYGIDGAIGEMVFVNSNDVDTRQKLEGYLAWKWALQNSLPSDHPYKAEAPTVPGPPIFSADARIGRQGKLKSFQGKFQNLGIRI